MTPIKPEKKKKKEEKYHVKEEPTNMPDLLTLPELSSSNNIEESLSMMSPSL